MNTFGRFAGFLLMLVALTAPTAVQAAADPAVDAGPRWACWYAPATLTIGCLLSRAPEANAEARAAEVASTIDSRLPCIVEKIWGNPASLADDRINIPLMTVPYEMSFVAELAESVMCGNRRDCSVHFDENPDGRAPLRAAALKAGASEADVLAELARQGLMLAAATVLVEQATEERKHTRRRRELRG